MPIVVAMATEAPKRPVTKTAVLEFECRRCRQIEQAVDPRPRMAVVVVPIFIAFPAEVALMPSPLMRIAPPSALVMPHIDGGGACVQNPFAGCEGNAIVAESNQACRHQAKRIDDGLQIACAPCAMGEGSTVRAARFFIRQHDGQRTSRYN